MRIRPGKFGLAARSAISEMFVVPIAPYVRAMPYNRNAEAKDPRMKYFIDDSFDLRSPFLRPAITYVAIDKVSSPRKITTRSLPADIIIMPKVAKRSRAWN